MDFGLVVDVVWKVGTLVGFGWMYLANRDKVTNARISKLEGDLDGKLDDHGNRITSLEANFSAAPGHAHLGDIYKRINGVEAQLGAVNGALQRMIGENAAMTRILNLVYESLIKDKAP